MNLIMYVNVTNIRNKGDWENENILYVIVFYFKWNTSFKVVVNLYFSEQFTFAFTMNNRKTPLGMYVQGYFHSRVVCLCVY